MTDYPSLSRVYRLGFAAQLAVTLLVGATGHLQVYWAGNFYQSVFSTETPYTVLNDIYSYGMTGCGEVASHG